MNETQSSQSEGLPGGSVNKTVDVLSLSGKAEAQDCRLSQTEPPLANTVASEGSIMSSVNSAISRSSSDNIVYVYQRNRPLLTASRIDEPFVPASSLQQQDETNRDSERPPSRSSDVYLGPHGPLRRRHTRVTSRATVQAELVERLRGSDRPREFEPVTSSSRDDPPPPPPRPPRIPTHGLLRSFRLPRTSSSSVGTESVLELPSIIPRPLLPLRPPSFARRHRDAPDVPISAHDELLRSVEALPSAVQIASETSGAAALPSFTEPLLEMGFTRRHVQMAVRAVGVRGDNDSDRMNRLVTWLLENPSADEVVM